MSLETFLYNLHFDIDKARPPDWDVDWDHAPLSYKLYHGFPGVPLSLEVPLTLKETKEPKRPDIYKIGHFLWYTFGLAQFSQTAYPIESTEQTADLVLSYRRFIPSGGALYPNELYLYLKMEDLPAGIYHYDVAHHRLVLLREGNFDSYLSRALGNRCDIPACFGIVFVSTVFWKNFFKYCNLAYRLQGLDAGVVIGQLQEVAKKFGFTTKVCYQFLDRPINHLLGLFEQDETVYAVISLSAEPASPFTDAKEGDKFVAAAELCRELPAIPEHHGGQSRKATAYPLITRINEASMLESTESFRKIKGKKRMDGEGPMSPLPHVKRLSYDLAEVCQMRYSPELDFFLGRISQTLLAALLQETTASFSYQNDLNGEHESRLSLYGCLYNVEGIPDGAYYYDSARHGLRQIHPGDYRLPLQSGMSADNVHLFQVPLCLHIAGDKDHLQSALGYRGYRIQQMEAGILLQKLLLAASALGMGGHPLVGFNVKLSDEIYRMDPQGKTSLIQIPVGPYRPRSWLRGSLRC